MKEINDLLPIESTTVPRDELDRMLQRDAQKLTRSLQKSREMADLHQMMAGMYPHKWTSAMGDEPDADGIWAAVLIDVPWVRIKHGFDQLVNKGYKWPPSAPEFRDLCLDVEKGVNVARAPSVEAISERLTGIEDKSNLSAGEVRANRISEIRKSLK